MNDPQSSEPPHSPIDQPPSDQPSIDDASLTMSLASLSASDEETAPVVRNAKASRKLDRTGQRLGHFIIESRLGEGGMGAVYRAVDTSLRRQVAVKVLRDSGDGSQSTASIRDNERLRREAVSQASLNHPHVVTIYYVGRENEEPFLAMELLSGPSLQQRIKEGPLRFDELIEYAIQVTDALCAADRRGLVHGDIKPSNLLMSGPGNVKLSDFGLARFHDSGEGDGSVSGTPYYLAPELVDGATPNRQTDMYALGVTLFELAFARRPYELSGRTLQQRLQTHRTAEIAFPQKWPANIPQGFGKLLERLLAKEPGQRPATYDQLREQLNLIRPIGSTLAGRLARLIAWTVDITCLMLLQMPFVVPINAINMGMDEQEYRDLNLGPEYFSFAMLKFVFGGLAVLGWILIPLLALWWDLKRYRTPGRFLMQLRVVDAYGLPLSRRFIILRNVLRYFHFWSGIFIAIPMAMGFMLASILTDTIGYVWILVDALLILGPLRKTIHDRICRTHVVLDEQTSRGESARVPGSSIHT